MDQNRNLEMLSAAASSRHHVLDDIVRKVTDLYFLYAIHGRLSEMWHLQARTGVELSPGILQGIYKRYIIEGSHASLSFLENLMRRTGVKPKEDIVQLGFDTYLAQDRFDKVEELAKVSEVSLPEKSVQKAYESFLVTKKYGLFWNLYDATHVKPKPSNNVVQAAYRGFIEKGDWYNLERLESTTEIKPDSSFYEALVDFVSKERRAPHEEPEN